MKLPLHALVNHLNSDHARYATQILSDSPSAITVNTIVRKIEEGHPGAAKLLKPFGHDGFTALCRLTKKGTLHPKVSIPILESFENLGSRELTTSLQILPYFDVPIIGRFISRLARRCFPHEIAQNVLVDFLHCERDDYRRFAFSELDDMLSSTEPMILTQSRSLLAEHTAVVERSIRRGGEDTPAALYCCAAYRDDPCLSFLRATLLDHESENIRLLACSQYLNIFDIRSIALVSELAAKDDIVRLLHHVIKDGSEDNRDLAIGIVYAFGLEAIPQLAKAINDARHEDSPKIAHAISDGEEMVSRRWLRTCAVPYR